MKKSRSVAEAQHGTEPRPPRRRDVPRLRIDHAFAPRGPRAAADTEAETESDLGTSPSADSDDPDRAEEPEELTGAQRYDLIDLWVMLLDELYVHLPQKRALYGYDPIRALEALRRDESLLDDDAFHRELMLVINRLRDAHTQYRPPGRIKGRVARLPFLVEAIGPAARPQFVVSKVAPNCIPDDAFTAGVQIITWNAMPIARVVEHHADTEVGGRPDARRARALDSLTFRSLEHGPPPEETHVDIEYVGKDRDQRSVRFLWRWIEPERAPGTERGAPPARVAIDTRAEIVRRAKKLMFSPTLWEAEVETAQIEAAEVEVAERAAAGQGAAPRRRQTFGRPIETPMQDLVTAKAIGTRAEPFGYLRLWSFNVDHPNAYIAEMRRLLRLLPQRGLVVDVRGNPGGHIEACERLLHLLAPNPIQPARFGLRATRLAAALANANGPSLGEWASSLDEALHTGEAYSQHLPLSDLDSFQPARRAYRGPIVAIVDATTYSCGDLFAAGFVDNDLGPIISVGTATGAGGANVWDGRDLLPAIASTGRRVPRLPPGAGLTLSLRRMVRTRRADGLVIEDVGVRGESYDMTLDDVLDSNKDLIAAALDRLRG